MKYLLKRLGTSKFSVLTLALVAPAFLLGNPVKAQAVSINVMQHICDASVQNVATFDNVDGPDANSTTEFHDKVLTCPTVIMPGDSYSSNGVHFPTKHAFDYSIIDANGEIQTISNANFQQRQVCEANATADSDNDATTFLPSGMDVNGDGQFNACLDTSLYTFSGIDNGFVSVIQSMAPGATRAGALEFTPDALMENNDEDALVGETTNTVFNSDNVILLDTAEDDDGAITLHVYNFVGANTPAVVVPGLPTTGGGMSTAEMATIAVSSLMAILGIAVYRKRKTV